MLKANVTPELLDRLSARVTEKTLNPDRILFTSEPLQSPVEAPEGATEETVKQVETQNRAIHEANEKLCREAKTLRRLPNDARIVEP